MKIGKRIFCMMLAVSFLFAMPIKAHALGENEISAPSALLMEAETGRVLYEKNPHEIRVCASITKVMTLLLVMEALDSGKIAMTDTVTTSAHASSMGGSDIWLEPGETMTVDEMIKATVVASANDAAVALAEHLCGTEDDFVAQMNNRAAELGMKDTVFKNCNGLDEDGHVTTAYDVALMSRELVKHKEIFKYTSIWMDTLREGKTQIVNTNKLLKRYPGITGLKTGTTGKAGSCISATAERNNLKLIAVTLGSSTGDERFSAASTLLDYGFANYTMHTPSLPENTITPIPVTNGMQATVNAHSELGSSLLIPKGKEKGIVCQIQIEDSVEAPVKQGQVLGKVCYMIDQETLAEYPITADCSVPKISFAEVFSIFIKQLLIL